MMKKLVALLCLFLMVFPACAQTAQPPLTVDVTLSAGVFTAPGPVDVSITVTNISGADMPGPCALYGPDGMRISEFGAPTLAAGESATWQGTWQVTDYMLDAGRIVYALVTAGTNADDPSALEYHHGSVSIIDLRDPLGHTSDLLSPADNAPGSLTDLFFGLH